MSSSQRIAPTGQARFAGAAVVRVDVEGGLTFVDAVDGALFDTGLVLDVGARAKR
jgi:hypothetical protein